ncbi:hypothetical protein CKAH01_13578 [Colletotrichum kahawae]|uniref:Uncharacterized protein n=1 Tax=Colletotrichum kahawae TaxID=34407 RepID=A0AAE0DDU1_COLKA|nr:hypothetical protein CKAH01_13578 [Colletotrichum kahawae]
MTIPPYPPSSASSRSIRRYVPLPPTRLSAHQSLTSIQSVPIIQSDCPARPSSAASDLLGQTHGAEKRLRKLTSLLHTRQHVDVFNTRVRSIIDDHARILACVTDAHSNAKLASDSAAEVTKFSDPKEKNAILNRSVWEKFASIFDRNHHNKYTEATAKLNDRAISLQEDAKALEALVAQGWNPLDPTIPTYLRAHHVLTMATVNAQLSQHATGSRLLTLYTNTKIEHGQLLSIWKRPDADKKLLSNLLGTDISQMGTPTGRYSQVCNEMGRFEEGQRALRKGEKRLVKGLQMMEGKLDRFNKDSVKARDKFAAGQLRAQKAKISGKLEDLETDTDSTYSYDEKM